MARLVEQQGQEQKLFRAKPNRNNVQQANQGLFVENRAKNRVYNEQKPQNSSQQSEEHEKKK